MRTLSVCFIVLALFISIGKEEIMVDAKICEMPYPLAREPKCENIACSDDCISILRGNSNGKCVGNNCVCSYTCP
ncbi:hypothetical protein M5689_001899 [Euphorbia peplus]|nr:hypothetical protein M5689_001899 [Euphorbia peplus]